MESDRFVVTMIDALNQLGVPYLLAGSFSSNYYGVPRSTKDADFVIQLGDVPVMRLKTVLPENFLLDPQVEFETVTGTLRNVVTVNRGEFKIELFRLSTDAHDQSRFQRRVAVSGFGTTVFFPTPEDVIVTKLRWLRAKDRADLMQVIAAQSSSLDWDYIYRWADEHKTRGVLDALRESIPSIA